MSFLWRDKIRTVGALENALLAQFPAKDAEEWDHTGIIAGDPEATISRVAVALDPTHSAIERAVANGANVLVTHHPIFLDTCDTFKPVGCGEVSYCSLIWDAIKSNVALMNFHTSLDVSIEGQQVLPGLLGLKQTKILEPISGSLRKGYGQVCTFYDAGGQTLAGLSERCISVFGRAPRVWGNPDTLLNSVVTCLGSVGDCGRKALNSGIDAVVCGEIKYHEALMLADSGLCIIELGHDVSELPLVGVLSAAIEKAGIAKDSIILVDQSANWHIPQIDLPTDKV